MTKPLLNDFDILENEELINEFLSERGLSAIRGGLSIGAEDA